MLCILAGKVELIRVGAVWRYQNCARSSNGTTDYCWQLNSYETNCLVQYNQLLPFREGGGGRYGIASDQNVKKNV